MSYAAPDGADLRHLIKRMKALGEERYGRASDEQERLKRELGDAVADIDIYSLFPPIPLDDTNRAVRDILVRLGYLQPEWGILSRILGRDGGAGFKNRKQAAAYPRS